MMQPCDSILQPSEKSLDHRPHAAHYAVDKRLGLGAVFAEHHQPRSKLRLGVGPDLVDGSRVAVPVAVLRVCRTHASQHRGVQLVQILVQLVPGHLKRVQLRQPLVVPQRVVAEVRRLQLVLDVLIISIYRPPNLGQHVLRVSARIFDLVVAIRSLPTCLLLKQPYVTDRWIL